MPHATLVPLTGTRVREPEMRALGMRLPGLAARGKAIGELPALGLLTLAGMTPEPWSVSYLPAVRTDDSLVARIAAERPALVAISALTASIEEAYRLAAELSRRSIPVVIGGLHVTACPDEAAQYGASVVVGPGEPVWHEVLADAEAGRLRERYTAPANSPPAWPLPRWDLHDSPPARFTLQTARGCPLACEFCGASRLLGRFQEKPLEQIDRELTLLNSYQARPLLELADDNTFAGSRPVAPFLDRLRASGARWFTEADWRIGERPEIVAGLASAGCVQVLMGIESLVFRYPGMGEKRAELARIMEAVAALQGAGVAVNGCFIVGAEGETAASLDRLADFLLTCPLAEIQITLQTPFPGTALHRRLAAEGRLLPNRGWPHYTLFDVTYQPDALSVAELEHGFRNLLARVFSAEATRRRQGLRRRIWQQKMKMRWRG